MLDVLVGMDGYALRRKYPCLLPTHLCEFITYDGITPLAGFCLLYWASCICNYAVAKYLLGIGCIDGSAALQAEYTYTTKQKVPVSQTMERVISEPLDAIDHNLI